MDKKQAALVVSATPAHHMNEEEINDWIKDPYMTVRIVDIETKEPLLDKESHIYFTRAEYKKIDPNTDLIFNFEMWEMFNRIMIYTDIYITLVDELDNAMISIGEQPIDIESMPCYLFLPYITRRKSILSHCVIQKGEL